MFVWFFQFCVVFHDSGGERCVLYILISKWSGVSGSACVSVNCWLCRVLLMVWLLRLGLRVALCSPFPSCGCPLCLQSPWSFRHLEDEAVTLPSLGTGGTWKDQQALACLFFFPLPATLCISIKAAACWARADTASSAREARDLCSIHLKRIKLTSKEVNHQDT